MPQPLCGILKELKSKPNGYDEREDFICWKPATGEAFVQFITTVEVETGFWGLKKNLEYDCDTTVYIQKINNLIPPKNSKYAIFSTPIPLPKEEEKYLSSEIINKLNVSNFLGKFILLEDKKITHQVFSIFRDKTNFKIGIGQEKQTKNLVYVTNHCLNHLDSTVLEAHIIYHGMIVAGVHRILRQESIARKSRLSS